MRAVVFALVSLVLCAMALPVILKHGAAANGDWPMYLHDASRTSANHDEAALSPANAAQLSPAWTVQTGGVVAAGATVVGGVVYIGSWDGYLKALDANTGQPMPGWTPPYLGQTNAPLCDPTQAWGITSTATVDSGVVYVGGGDSNLYAVNAVTGAVLWSVFLGDNSPAAGHYNWSSPLLYNGFIYVGEASFCDIPLVQGQLLKISLATHQIVATFNVVPNGQIGGGIWTSPTIDTSSNTIFAVTGNENPTATAPEPYARSILALDATTLALKSSWQDPNGPGANFDWGTTPVLFTDTNSRQLVTASNKDGNVYAFDRANLAVGPVWQTQIAIGGPDPEGNGDGTVSSVAFDGTTIYAAGGNTTINATSVRGSVRALDPATGAIKWEHAAAATVLPALAYANGLIVDGTGNHVEVLDASNGNLLASFATGSVLYGPPSVSNGFIYEGSTDHSVYAFTVAPPAPTATAVPGGMSAYYAMESASWNGTPGEVLDSSGNALNGTSVAGAQTGGATPAIAGDPGSCRYATGFNGSTSYLDLGTPQVTFPSGVTVMAWVRWAIDPASGNNWANIVSNNSNLASDVGQFWLQHSQFNSNFEFAVATSNATFWVQSSVIPQRGVWQHVAGVYDGSTLTIYVNGMAAGTAPLTGNVVPPAADYHLTVGRWAFNSQTFRSFDGDIDEVRIYPRALSAGEVGAAMGATHPCSAAAPTATPTPPASVGGIAEEPLLPAAASARSGGRSDMPAAVIPPALFALAAGAWWFRRRRRPAR